MTTVVLLIIILQNKVVSAEDDCAFTPFFIPADSLDDGYR